MDGANRKIELQSPEDLTYLINNVRRAATEHINAAFPPVDDADAQEEDELRVRIESIVDEVSCTSIIHVYNHDEGLLRAHFFRCANLGSTRPPPPPQLRAQFP